MGLSIDPSASHCTCIGSVQEHHSFNPSLLALFWWTAARSLRRDFRLALISDSTEIPVIIRRPPFECCQCVFFLFKINPSPFNKSSVICFKILRQGKSPLNVMSSAYLVYAQPKNAAYHSSSLSNSNRARLDKVGDVGRPCLGAPPINVFSSRKSGTTFKWCGRIESKKSLMSMLKVWSYPLCCFAFVTQPLPWTKPCTLSGIPKLK